MTSVLLLSAILLPGIPGEEPKVRPSRLEVRVDPRVELLSLVMRLAGNPEYTRAADSEHVRALDERFKPFAEHEVVKLVRQLRRFSGISYDAPQTLAAHLSRDPALDLLVPLEPWPVGLDSRWMTANLPVFLEKLRAFARESRFFEIFESRRPFFEKLEAVYREAAEKENAIPWFDGLFGERPAARFTLVPAPLAGQNNYGVRAVLADGSESLYQILGVTAYEPSGDPRLGSGFVPLLVHEMAHSYCNPLIDLHIVALSGPGEKLFRQTEEAMKKQAYGTGRTVLCESFVRACVVLHALERGGEGAAAKALADEESRSFFWTGELVETLRRFRAAPPPSGRLADFMPEVVAAFEKAAAKDWKRERLPFRGPHNAVIGAPDLLFVRPDPCPEPLRKFLDDVHGRFYEKKGVKSVKASEVAAETAAARSLVLYGTPATNPLLERVASAAGWEIGAARIRLGDRVLEGENLVLLACWPSPFGERRAVGVYAAASPELLEGINGVFHGPTDWVVARRGPGGKFETVARGDFPKDLANRWGRLPAE
jgi:hypothetical protein